MCWWSLTRAEWGGALSGVAVRIEQDAVPGHLRSALGQQVGAGDGKLKTGWIKKSEQDKREQRGLGDRGEGQEIAGQSQKLWFAGNSCSRCAHAHTGAGLGRQLGPV